MESRPRFERPESEIEISCIITFVGRTYGDMIPRFEGFLLNLIGKSNRRHDVCILASFAACLFAPCSLECSIWTHRRDLSAGFVGDSVKVSSGSKEKAPRVHPSVPFSLLDFRPAPEYPNFTIRGVLYSFQDLRLEMLVK